MTRRKPEEEERGAMEEEIVKRWHSQRVRGHSLERVRLLEGVSLTYKGVVVRKWDTWTWELEGVKEMAGPRGGHGHVWLREGRQQGQDCGGGGGDNSGR